MKDGRWFTFPVMFRSLVWMCLFWFSLPYLMRFYSDELSRKESGPHCILCFQHHSNHILACEGMSTLQCPPMVGPCPGSTQQHLVIIPLAKLDQLSPDTSTIWPSDDDNNISDAQPTPCGSNMRVSITLLCQCSLIIRPVWLVGAPFCGKRSFSLNMWVILLK